MRLPIVNGDHTSKCSRTQHHSGFESLKSGSSFNDTDPLTLVFRNFIYFSRIIDTDFNPYPANVENMVSSAFRGLNTVMRRLTTGISSEKCVVRRFRRCANAIQCTYTNPDSTV